MKNKIIGFIWYALFGLVTVLFVWFAVICLLVPSFEKFVILCLYTGIWVYFLTSVIEILIMENH